jgi:uncharacterized protein
VIETEAFLNLVRTVEKRAPLVNSPDHGAHHWRLVAVTGADLIKTEPAADPLVVLLFALFHDSQRENEYVDPEHGARGALLGGELIPVVLPQLDSGRLDTLCRACELHTTAPPTEDPTLGTCWDSDRLSLWRVYIEPAPLYLSTREAKRPERIQWTKRLQEEDFTWEEILKMYEQF